MNSRDWNKLCLSIKMGNCILFLGSEFPIQIEKDNKIEHTSISAEISKLIKGELEEPLPPYIEANELQLSELANFYLQKKTKEDLVRDVLEEWYMNNKNYISIPLLSELLKLPFTFIVDTTCFNLFFEQISKYNGKNPKKAHYDFKGAQLDLISTPLGKNNSIGTTENPFVYNLYGSIDEIQSVAISEYELIQLLTNLISKNPSLPTNVKTELSKCGKNFLFIGFGILAKNWYFKVMLHTLEFGSKDLMSYATDNANIADYSSDPTVVFFKNSLRTSLYRFDPLDFVGDLVHNYGNYEGDSQAFNNPVDSGNQERPRIFISYKKEDYDVAIKIKNLLEINNQAIVWIDKKDLQGKIDQGIKENIDDSNAFVLLQSKNLINQPVSYVQVEIDHAKKRAKYYRKADDFIFSVMLDDFSYESRLLPKYAPYYLFNRTDERGTDQLIRDIVRSFERNKKKGL